MNREQLTLGRRSAAKQQTSRKMTGFTLVEMMVVVAITGILMMIALPSYQNYTRASQRASTQGYLVAVAQQQQQYLMDNRSYAPSLEALGYETLPSQISRYYTIAIQLISGPQQGFLVTATPNGDQAMDSCATLIINNTGTKTSSSGQNCW